MAKKSKLLNALDRHQGRDYDLERQEKLRKQAKRKKVQTEVVGDSNIAISNGGTENDSGPHLTNLGEDDSDESDKDDEAVDLDAIINEGDLEEEDEEEDDADENDGIALSDIESLGSSEKDDLIPYQRLTINNTTALLTAHKSIALQPNLPFSAHQVLLTDVPVEIPDVHDDLTRELAFYKQCLSGAEKGRKLLKQEGIPFSRPNDFFAEMVKNDEHMGKVKRKMVEDAGAKKASQEAKRQRELKKFGKQVQVAKEQERAKEKKSTMAKIDLLKKKRKSGDIGGPNEEDQFDIALEDATKTTPGKSDRGSRGSQRPNKRQKKDEKFGFGGRKRFGKSGDAISSGDVSGFSASKMKGKWQKAKRPGKSKRASKP